MGICRDEMEEEYSPKWGMRTENILDGEVKNHPLNPRSMDIPSNNHVPAVAITTSYSNIYYVFNGDKIFKPVFAELIKNTNLELVILNQESTSFFQVQNRMDVFAKSVACQHYHE
ncbi:hypothetical protein TSUD_37880 [Trifolium subterraneum]|uniref:Uncharacterized protein n=1 Tax=Trifolium subterraneum TaxID=3900 RepID=A0A2Z6NUD5_TRISU|nr:hypothetical protein TSUD_37880 [Trifolium subterraneum]